MWRVLSKYRFSSSQIILIGFAGVILVGALILMLPLASVSGEPTSFWDALFTATSAVCVTGLVVHDTALYWSGFGQAVILVLIQIGGMGVITVASAITIASGKKLSILQRSTMQDAISAPQIGGIVRFTGAILRGTVLFEVLGALALMTVFIPEFGLKGIWYSVFHSISAFCNAGFDLMGGGGAFSSLTAYADNPVVNITVMLLIIIGGIGFLTWQDIRANGRHLRRYRMQSKVILTITGVLLVVPSVWFFFFEFTGEPLGRRLLMSLFQAVTPRTAGFNTADLTSLSDTGRALTIGLMLIGGSPGSTAGGMKTTTVAVLVASAAAVYRRRQNGRLYGRRIADDTVKNAVAVMLMYLVLFLLGGMIISTVEELPLLTCLFETASAIGTVGLTLGITPGLQLSSRLVLICLMFLGRVGGLTLIFATLSSPKNTLSRLPLEKITVG